MFRRLLLLLLVVGFAFSIDINNCTAQVNLNESNTVYNVVADLNFTGAVAGTACLVVNATNVTLDCNNHIITGTDQPLVGAVFVRWQENATVMNCIATNFTRPFTVTLSNHTLVKSNRAYNTSGQYAFFFRDDINTTVDGNFAYNNSQYGFAFQNNSNATVTSNNANYSLISGMGLVSCDGMLLRDNRAYTNFLSGIWLFDSDGNNITGNEIEIENITTSNAFIIQQSSGNHITYNNFTAGGMWGYTIFSNNSPNNVYEHNTIRGGQFTFWMQNTSSNDVRSNIISCDKYGVSALNVLTSSYNNNFTYNNISATPCNYTVYVSTGSTSTYNNFSHNNVGPSDYGFYIIISNRNFMWNNSVRGNSDSGLYLAGANNNTMLENRVYNNGMAGIQMVLSQDNSVMGNDVYNGTGYGVLINMSSNNNFTGNLAYNNSGSGFYITNSSGNTLINNSAYNNAQNGFSLYGPLLFDGVFDNHFFGNAAYNNSGNGLYLYQAYFNTFQGTISYTNLGYGVYFDKSNQNNMTDSVIYGNSLYGIYINDPETSVFNRTFVYNQSGYSRGDVGTVLDALALGYNSTVGIVNFTRMITATGALRLFTNESSLQDGTIILRGGWVSMNDSAVPDANVSANITLTSASTDYVVYKKSGFPITQPDILTGSRYLTSKSCAGGMCIFNVSGFSGYTLGDPGCLNLSDPSTWGDRVVNDTATGILNVNRNTTLCRDTYYLNIGGSRAIEMNASNIFLDCNLSTIDGVDKSGTGIYTTYKENNTIMNCTVRNYNDGISLAQGSVNDALLSNIAHNNSNRGFYLTTAPNSLNRLTGNSAHNNTNGFLLIASSSNNFENNSAYNNSNSGFMVTAASENNSFLNNSAYANTAYGFYVDSSGGNSFSSDRAYGNQNTGFYIILSDNTILSGASAYGNAVNGFHIESSYFGSMSDSRAYGNLQNGIDTDDAQDNIFTNVLSCNNTQYGLYVFNSPRDAFNNVSACNNSRGFYLISDYDNITNSFAYNNSYGIYLSGSLYTTISGSSAYNNTQVGFETSAGSHYTNLTANRAFLNYVGFNVTSSNFTRLINNSAYSNGYAGIELASSHENVLVNNSASDGILGIFLSGSSLNTLINNTVVNNGFYGISLSSSHRNAITRNLGYGAGIGAFELTFSENNTLENNTARDNSNVGFLVEAFANLNNLTNNTAYNNNVGFYLSSASVNRLADSLSRNNNVYGFYVIASSSNVLINSMAYGNPFGGFYLTSSNYNSLANSTSHSNSGFAGNGFYASDSFGNGFTDTVAYNNSNYGIYLFFNSVPTYNSFSNTIVYNQSSYIYASTSGNQNNFTNLTLGYTNAIGLVNYPSLNLTSVDLNPADFLLNPDWVSLDDSSSNAIQANASANITISTNTCLFVLKRTGFPITKADILNYGKVYSTSLTCIGAGPYTAVFNVTGFSGYAVDDYTACANLSDSTTWANRIVEYPPTGTLYVNRNTTLCTDHYYRDMGGPVTNYSMRMNSSNIYLNCSGSIIDGVDKSAIGLYMDNINISGPVIENDTVNNCTIINYANGFRTAGGNRNLISNINTSNISGWGIVIENGNNNTISNCYASYVTGHGIAAQGGSDNVIRDSTSYRNQYGLGANGNRNNFSNIYVLNSTRYGVYIEGTNLSLRNIVANVSSIGGVYATNTSANNYLDNMTVDLSAGDGINLNNSGYNTIGNSTVSNSGGNGVYVFGGSNTLRNNLAHDNAGTGVYLEYSNSSVLDNNTAYGNYIGFSVYYSNYGVFSNNTAYNSADQGFRFWDSSGNNFTDTVAHSNGNWALMAFSPNQFTNTFFYNQTAYMYVTSGGQSNFTNLTLGYNRTVGLINYPSMNTTSNVMPYEGGNVYIQPDWVSINPADADIGQAATSAAYITINNSNCAGLGVLQGAGFPASLAAILSTGTHYPSARTCNGDLATFYVTGFSGYTLGQEATTITSFTATPSSPVDVGTMVNISCGASNPEVILEIYINGTLVQSGNGSIWYDEILPVGSYEFICNTTGNENYTNASGTPISYTVNKITTSLTLTSDPSWTVTPGTTTNVSCDASNGVVLMDLYRDDVLIDSNYGHVEEVVSLAIGSYEYVCNTTGAENYTSATSTDTLTVRRPSGGGGGEECVLSISMDSEIPVGVPADIEVRRSSGANPSNALVRIWKNVAGAVPEEFRTNVSGHISFTPSETGGYTIAAFLSGCSDADGTFSVYAPAGELAATLEPSCNGSVITVTQTVCTGGETDGGGFLECMDAPVEGALVSIYRCQEDWETAGDPVNTCSELIDTLTTDEAGEAITYERDAHVRIVADLGIATHFVGTTIFGDLPDSEDCPPPAQEISINFDPACEGSTVTVTGTVCEEGVLMQDLSPNTTIAYLQCEEDRPLPGMRVQIYCCPEDYEQMDLTHAQACTDLVDSGTTDSAGMFITDARDCTAMILVERPLDTMAEDTSIIAGLPTAEECGECVGDSDCPEGYVCRDKECIQEEIPPDQRRCSSDMDCTNGYRCSGGMCTQIRACASDPDCRAGEGCLEGVCYTDEEIEVITGGQGGVEGGIAGMLKNIYDVIIRSSWLILLLIVALLLFWFFYWKRRKKKKPLTQEEMIAKEQEYGTRPPVPPRPQRRPPKA